MCGAFVVGVGFVGLVIGLVGHVIGLVIGLVGHVIGLVLDLFHLFDLFH